MPVVLFRFLAVACSVLPAWAGAQPLRVVASHDYPPYVYRKPDGKVEGYEVDIWKLWQKKTGIEVQFTPGNWAQAQRMAQDGKADVIDLIFRTPARESLYDFSPPFAAVTTAIFADASIPGIYDLRSLRGFEVGVQEGDACAEKLYKAGIPGVRTFPDYSALIGAVADQRIKLFCMDDYAANYYLYRRGLQTRFVKAFDVYQDWFRRAARKGQGATLATVERGMALITDEEEAALRQKWMGSPFGLPGYGRRLGQALLVLVGVILGLLVWLQSVRKAVRKRTAELEQEKAQLDTLVENSPDVIWLKDSDGIYRACNRSGASLIGRAPQEVIGKTDYQLFDAPVAEQFRRDDLRALESRQRVASEEHMTSALDGTQRVLELIRTAIIQPSGTLLGILGVGRDITERRRQEQKIRDQEELLKEMSSLAKIGGWELDLESGAFEWTEEVARIHEANPQSPRTLVDCLEDYYGDSRNIVENAMNQTIATGKPHGVEVELVSASGKHKWVHDRWRAKFSGGKVVKLSGTVQDVTERHELEESMRMANLIYQTSSEAIVVTDAANHIVDTNPAYLREVSCDLQQVIGKVPRIFCSEMHDEAFYRRLTQELQEHDHWEGEIWGRSRDGSSNAKYVNIRVIRDADGHVYRHVIQFYDITEQKQRDELIWKHTNFDLLTGLPNRRLFLDRLEQEVKKAQATGKGVALMFVDLDRFKHINDSLGHAGGDQVLIDITARIQRAIPESATLARLGGDEFAIIVGDFDKRLHLEMTAEAMIEAVSAPLDVGDGELVYVSASVGITLYPDDGKDAGELIKNAEQAMYLAKREGRNRFSYFTPSLQQEARTKLMLTNDLRHALARKQLQVFYQPIVDVATGRIRKAEALLRWDHPEHGMISPTRFIPLAEESGLIVEIGEWVFQEAISSIQRWQQKFGSVVELSVNNSPVQFEHSEKCEWIDQFAVSGLPPDSITIEITEGVLINDSDLVRRCLKRLHDAGAKVSIDDFGTGFSALSYLKHFDVDYLKIDKSFIHNLNEDASDKALTEAIIDMAHKLRIETIAEGVETDAQRDILALFGCDYIQGYLYSRPVSREMFEALLEHQMAH